MSTEVAVVPEVTTSPKVKKDPKVKKMNPKVKGAKKVAPASHPPFALMVKNAISSLKEKGGSSQMVILRYIMANYTLGSDAKRVNTHLRLALRRGVKAGDLVQPKGPSGRVKLGEKVKTTATASVVKSPKEKAGGKAPTTKKVKPSVKKVTKSPGKPPKKAKSPAKVGKSPKKPKAATKPAAAKPKPKKSPKKAVKTKKVAKK